MTTVPHKHPQTCSLRFRCRLLTVSGTLPEPEIRLQTTADCCSARLAGEECQLYCKAGKFDGVLQCSRSSPPAFLADPQSVVNPKPARTAQQIMDAAAMSLAARSVRQQSHQSQLPPMQALPQSLLSRILRWLPTQDMLRAEYVCRSWRTALRDLQVSH